MSRKKLLKSIDKSKLSFKNISQNGLKRIAKMQNFSQNEREQNTRMKSLPQNELATIRHIKKYEKLFKRRIINALLRSEQSPAELYKSESNILRTNFSKEK